MVALVDFVMFGNGEGPAPQQAATDPTAASAAPVAQLTCRVNSYTVIVKNDTAALLAEMMKTIFNITLDWNEKDDLNEVEILTSSVLHCLLLRLL